MMEACRKLRIALGDDEYSAAVATSDRGEKFIQGVSSRALEAKLSTTEAYVAKERVDADLATLEWMLLAEAAGTLTLPDDARTSAATQAGRLRQVRDSKLLSELQSCFIMVEPEAADEPALPAGKPQVEYKSSALGTETTGASIDRALQKSGALSGTLDGLGIDDDVD